MEPRRLFIAGSTGATGRAVVRYADAHGVAIVPHARPRPDRRDSDPRAAIVDLADTPALVAAMRGCTTVLQLIGTIRARFASGDTYERSDIATTQQLVDAAKRAGVDHFVLLSSVGAGMPVGAYLAAKARAEAIVRDSGIPWTTLRPSAFEGDRHTPPKSLRTFTRALGLALIEPIALDELAAALVRVALDRAPVAHVLSGRALHTTATRPAGGIGVNHRDA